MSWLNSICTLFSITRLKLFCLLFFYLMMQLLFALFLIALTIPPINFFVMPTILFCFVLVFSTILWGLWSLSSLLIILEWLPDSSTLP